MIAVQALLASTGNDDPIVLWVGVVALALVVAVLTWWTLRHRGVDDERRDREHRRDADWGSRPSDGMEL